MSFLIMNDVFKFDLFYFKGFALYDIIMLEIQGL